jgi:DNA-binding MarR family transcriptional regulator
MTRLEAKPGHLIRRAHQISVAIFMEESAAFDITPVQYGALIAIRDHPGVDATRLSALIAFDRSTIGAVLERLEAKGLIERSGSPEDKRVKVLRIRPEAEQLLRRMEPAVERARARVLAPLAPEDRDRFMALLAQLVEVNNEASRAPLRIVGGGRGGF